MEYQENRLQTFKAKKWPHNSKKFKSSPEDVGSKSLLSSRLMYSLPKPVSTTHPPHRDQTTLLAFYATSLLTDGMHPMTLLRNILLMLHIALGR